MAGVSCLTLRLAKPREQSQVTMKKIPLVGKILIGFVLGTAPGLTLAERCAPATAKKVLPYVAPFGDVSVTMLKTEESEQVKDFLDVLSERFCELKEMPPRRSV